MFRRKGCTKYAPDPLLHAVPQPVLLASSIVAGADEVIPAHGHVAAVFVAEAAHGDAQANLFLHQLSHENLTQIA